MIESPISDAKLAALGVSREKMLDRIRSAVSFATGAGISVAFFGVDSSRADLEFYRRAYDTAVEAGAQEVVVVDTIGIATPEAAAFLVGQTVDWLGGEIPVHWHGHDDFGLGTAAAIAAVQAGATWVQGTINGMGERAGNADLIEVALALEALYGIPTRLDLTQARALSRLVQERAGTPLPSWKAVTGDALFTRESGAVAAQFHDPPAIEPYTSELVGATRGLVLGKKSGIDSIRIKAAELGLDVAEERRADLLAAVKALGVEKRRLVSDDEFRALVRDAPAGDVCGKPVLTRARRAGYSSALSLTCQRRVDAMRFSLYSELQLHPGKSPQQLYAEVLEQIVNADRLGYDCYAVIEHFFYPKFSISTNPTALFAAAAQRTRDIHFRTMLHALPYHNPMVLAGVIAATDILTGGRYEWGVGRGHGWIPLPAGEPLDEHARPRYEEAVDLLFTALENERFSHHGTYFDVDDSHVVPFSIASTASISAAPPIARTRSPPSTAGASRCRRCCPTSRSSSSSTSTARPAPSTAPSPTSCGSTPAISTRTARPRSAEARDWVHGLHPGQLLAADRVAEAARRRPQAGGLRLLRGRDHGRARAGAVREADRGRLRLGRHAATTSSSGSRRRRSSARASRRSASP